MHRPGANHLDRRRRLLPRSYFERHDDFGITPNARRIVPDAGDRASAEVAWLQHELVLEWRRRRCRPSGAAIGREFGFSKQVWSRVVTGHRWMGETVAVVLIKVLRTPQRRA